MIGVFDFLFCTTYEFILYLQSLLTIQVEIPNTNTDSNNYSLFLRQAYLPIAVSRLLLCYTSRDIHLLAVNPLTGNA
jgi:hypothetical protein